MNEVEKFLVEVYLNNYWFVFISEYFFLFLITSYCNFIRPIFYANFLIYVLQEIGHTET